jgi:hypothetical protein
MREEITVTYSDLPTSSYVEIWRLHSSPEGGNVVLIVPLGAEAIRSEKDSLPKVGKPPPAPRRFRYRSPASTVEFTAPNGLGVAVIQLAAVDTEIQLEKGVPNLVALGLVSMRIEPRHLIRGSKFIAPPRRLACPPNLGGASPRLWEYTIPARFDGFRLIAELCKMSTGLDNKNLPSPIPDLDSNEEIVMTIPTESLLLTSTLDAPSTSVDLAGNFILRDRRRI